MVAPEIKRTASPLKAWVRALERTSSIDRNPTQTLPVLIGTLAQRFGNAAAVCSPSTTLSFGDLASECDAYASWGLNERLTYGDVVCLFMENRPEYLAVWLGLTRIGVTVALINTNLAGDALSHSICTVNPRFVITSHKLAPALREIHAGIVGVRCLELSAERFCLFDPLGSELAPFKGKQPDGSRFRPPTLQDRALCIYTSGTTGLPKAANVSHYRLMQWSHWFAGLMDVTPADRMFNCLPLYHSVGGVVAVGATLVGGGTVILRERFSVTNFWDDVTREQCTLFQYIGELCRYLLNAPIQPNEAAHSLRLACGNGLRAEVWVPFQERFRVPQVLEYYAATEGNFSLYNCEGRPGAVGRIPPFLTHRLPVALVKFDLETGAPLRTSEGRCQRCAVDEAGEAIGQIVGDQEASRFEGYTDPAASAKKILHDVFTAGDRWYRTGDLMRQDAQGFYYFVDRVGDTFRWKGENVSTTEVAEVISACAGVTDVAVYGVTVPHADGRAGMAALVVNEAFDLATFRGVVASRLPAYARPLFLRILSALEITGTFKLRKQDLLREGYDPTLVRDRLFIDSSPSGAYIPLDDTAFRALQSGALRI